MVEFVKKYKMFKNSKLVDQVNWLIESVLSDDDLNQFLFQRRQLINVELIRINKARGHKMN